MEIDELMGPQNSQGDATSTKDLERAGEFNLSRVLIAALREDIRSLEALELRTCCRPQRQV